MDLSAGGHVRCEDLRDLQGGPGGELRSGVANDGLPPDYSYLAEAQTPDPKGYARPKGRKADEDRPRPGVSSPARSANAAHGAPLAAPSCNPPTPSSDHLTVGTPDGNGRPVALLGLS